MIFLTVGISFSYLTFLTVTDGSGNGMAAFSPIKLGQNAPAVIFIINIIKQIQRFVDAPHFNDCLSQSGRTFTFQQ
ncbi:hypothetical protein ACP89_18255 [Pseudomonas oleovorans]|nr:hypothetical protein [Pseudomonas oleovorans]MBN7141978.1 hypothetical protein [Pseudomonas oleovorans]